MSTGTGQRSYMQQRRLLHKRSRQERTLHLRQAWRRSLDARPSSEGNGSANGNGGVCIRHGERTKCAVTMVHKSSYQKRIIHQAWGMEEAEAMQ